MGTLDLLKIYVLFCIRILPCKLPNLVSLRGQKSKKMKYLRMQGRMHIFEKMSQNALNHVLILKKYRTHKMLQIPLTNIDLQNDFNILVAKQWNIKISVPMSYIWLVYWYYFNQVFPYDCDSFKNLSQDTRRWFQNTKRK